MAWTKVVIGLCSAISSWIHSSSRSSRKAPPMRWLSSSRCSVNWYLFISFSYFRIPIKSYHFLKLDIFPGNRRSKKIFWKASIWRWKQFGWQQAEMRGRLWKRGEGIFFCKSRKLSTFLMFGVWHPHLQLSLSQYKTLSVTDKRVS